MEDIKVGEKIRCNDGLIGELIRIERDDIDTSLKWYVFDDGKNERYVNKPYITKHSFNLIDLIEVGDILELKEGNSICYLGLRKNQITVNYPDLIESIKNKDCELLSILTHEQYEANCYKVIRKKESK